MTVADTTVTDTTAARPRVAARIGTPRRARGEGGVEMPVLPYLGTLPELAEDVDVDADGFVVGKVTIGGGGRVAPRAVVRGDQCYIVIGRRFRLGAAATVHVDPERPAILGDDVVVEERAVVHGCHLGDAVLVERGATVLTGSVVREESIVQAGALVPEGKQFPPRSVLGGAPAKVVRQTTDAEVAHTRRRAAEGRGGGAP